MKPFQVNAGEWAPDVESALEKAKDMLKSVERDDSAIRNVRGVEETQAAHYWTNQQLPETDIESVSKKASSAENVKMIDGNPHQTGSTLAMHENNAGGNAHPSEALTKAPLDALMGGGPGPMGDMDDKPPMGGDDDDAQSLASRIKDMIDDLADKAGGDKPDMPDMGDMGDDMDAGPTLKAISAIIHKGKKCPGCGKQMGVDKGMCKGAGDC
jgi:hypothetical protein